MKIRPLTLLATLTLIAPSAFALTVRTKSDLRLWETVTDRSQPLSWTWVDDATGATLAFSNRLTRVVTFFTVSRSPGEGRGSCPHPVASAGDEALIVATLEQTADGIVIARDAAELAYVPGVGCVENSCVATAPSPSQDVATHPITVRAKDRDWYRVEHPRLSAFDASWWNVTGPSGYEVMWRTPSGSRRVERAFGGEPVDEVMLTFGSMRFLLMIR